MPPTLFGSPPGYFGPIMQKKGPASTQRQIPFSGHYRPRPSASPPVPLTLVKVMWFLKGYYWPGNILGEPTRGRWGQSPLFSNDALDHHFLNLCNGFCRVQTLGAGLGAVHDRVAAIEFERVFQLVETLACRFVAAVDDPAVGVEQCGRAEVAVAVPPVAWSGRRTACAHDAYVKTVHFPSVFDGLAPFFLRAVCLGFKPRHD